MSLIAQVPYIKRSSISKSKQTFDQGLCLTIAGSAFPFGLSYKRYFKTIENNKILAHTGLSVADILSPLDTPGPFITVPLGLSIYKSKVCADLRLGPTTLPN